MEELNTVDAVQESAVETSTPEDVTSEVAEETPIEETVEEVASPQLESDRDHAFAEMRKNAERYKKQNDRLLSNAKALGFDGESPDDILIAMQAHVKGTTPDEERKAYEHDIELESLREENEMLKGERLNEIVNRDLKAVTNIDPKIKSLDDFGKFKNVYLSAMAQGSSPADAYNAVKALMPKKELTQMGDIKPETIEKDYFTVEEVKAMSDAEIDKNYDKIRKSQERWK